LLRTVDTGESAFYGYSFKYQQQGGNIDEALEETLKEEWQSYYKHASTTFTLEADE
jgi:hypothetical protein